MSKIQPRFILIGIFILAVLIFALQRSPHTLSYDYQDKPIQFTLNEPTFFAFQCRTLRWDNNQIPETVTVNINSIAVTNVNQHNLCFPRNNIITITNENGITETYDIPHQNAKMDSILGFVLLVGFVWLLHIHILPRATIKWDTLTLFALAWGLAYFFHLASYSMYARTVQYYSVPVPLIAMLLVLRPQWRPLLFLLAATQLIEYYAITPYSSNHTMLITYGNVIILVTGCIAYLRAKRQNSTINYAQYQVSIFSLLRIAVPVLYFWAFFHKLNTSFLNPTVSCTTEFYGNIVRRYDFIPFPQGLLIDTTNIYLTLVVEGSLALLFLNKRTRFIGILLGLGFHAFIGLDNFRDFSVLMMAYYVTYLPDDFGNILHKYLQSVPNWLKLRLYWQSLWAVIVAILVLTMPGVARETYRLTPTIIILAIIMGIAIGCVCLYLFDRWQAKKSWSLAIQTTHSAIVWVSASLLMLNGATPYLGIKTDLAFDMYSNMITEGESNHLIIPANTQLFGFTSDLVTIIDSDDGWLQYYAEENIRVPFIHFREMLYESEAQTVTYERNGEIVTISAENFEATIGEPLHPLLAKIWLFQIVLPDRPHPCTW